MLGRIGKLFFFFSTLFIVSISLAGILYTDSFSRELGFDFSMFDLNAYTFFTQVLISDKYQVLGYGVVGLIFIISFVCVYPKSLLLVYDLFFILGLYLLSLLPNSFFLFIFLMFSPFLLPLLLIILILLALVIKIEESNFIKDKWRKINFSLDKNEHYKKINERKNHNESAYFKAIIVFIVMASSLKLWLSWIIDVGQQGQVHAQKHLDSTKYKTLYLTNNTKLKVVMVSKVKNGYIFVLNENNKNKEKASFIPDNVILRIDSF